MHTLYVYICLYALLLGGACRWSYPTRKCECAILDQGYHVRAGVGNFGPRATMDSGFGKLMGKMRSADKGKAGLQITS